MNQAEASRQGWRTGLATVLAAAGCVGGTGVVALAASPSATPVAATASPSAAPTATPTDTPTPQPTAAPTPDVTPTPTPMLTPVDPLAPKATAAADAPGGWPTWAIVGLLLAGLAAMGYGGYEFFRTRRPPGPSG